MLRITPTANRNSYRVARLVEALPRVACFARNPGLGKRNSVRVAWDAFSPRWVKYIVAREPVSPSSRVWSRQQALFKPSRGKGFSPNCLKHNKKELSPLGESWRGAFSVLSPLGELERGSREASRHPTPFIYIRARGLGGHSDDRLNFCWHEWRWLLTEFCGLRRLLFW